MSPPEVWGPAVWTLFHTLSEKINDKAYPFIGPQLFNMILRICKFLPCPECSVDATNFLAKIKFSNMKNKIEFKNTFYLFHNWVNAKKRKPLFNYGYIGVYGKYNLVNVVNNFLKNYQTKGNMKLINESFQRQLIIKDFKNWFTATIKAFIPPLNIPIQISAPASVPILEEKPVIIEEEHIKLIVAEEHIKLIVAEEPVIVVEEPVIIEEEPVIAVEEPIKEIVLEESVIVEEEPIVEEESVIVEEEIIKQIVVEEQFVVKPKKGKKSKGKK